jgi:hypothetical protein
VVRSPKRDHDIDLFLEVGDPAEARRMTSVQLVDRQAGHFTSTYIQQ